MPELQAPVVSNAKILCHESRDFVGGMLYYNVLTSAMSRACEGRFPLFTLVDHWMFTVDVSLQMNRYQSLKVIIQDEG
jgi:hypothetical protein